jgi:hypothetical protein
LVNFVGMEPWLKRGVIRGDLPHRCANSAQLLFQTI